MTVSVTQSIHRALQQHPQRIATVSNGRRQTYAEFVGRVQRLAGGLRDLGVRKGDRVVMVIASNECSADLNSAVDSALNS